MGSFPEAGACNLEILDRLLRRCYDERGITWIDLSHLISKIQFLAGDILPCHLFWEAMLTTEAWKHSLEWRRVRVRPLL